VAKSTYWGQNPKFWITFIDQIPFENAIGLIFFFSLSPWMMIPTQEIVTLSKVQEGSILSTIMTKFEEGLGFFLLLEKKHLGHHPLALNKSKQNIIINNNNFISITNLLHEIQIWSSLFTPLGS